MTLDTIAEEAAKRSLVQYLQHFLDAADRNKAPLTAWETDVLCQVMALLQTGHCLLGKEVMIKLDRPDRYCTPEERARVANGPVLTVAEMRANLERATSE